MVGKPDDLLSLSDSKNARVRQVVIMVMWSLYKVPTTTPGWRPFPYSVIPFDPSRAIDPIRESGVDPNTLTGQQGEFQSSQMVRGNGKQGCSIRRQDASWTAQSLICTSFCVVFSTPCLDHRTVQLQKRQPERLNRLARWVAHPRKRALNASWENKKTLVAAIRDLALRVPSADETTLYDRG